MSARQFYTYLHCLPDGAPFYVGKGHGKRCFRLSRNVRHKAIVDMYGADNILVYVFPCESEAEAIRDEIIQIAGLRRDGYALTNITMGGNGVCGAKHSAESKKKMSVAKLGKPLSQEHRAKISKANKGKQITFGRRHSEETKRKMSESRKGKPGVRPSIATRAKLAASHLGQIAWNKGVPSPFRGIQRPEWVVEKLRLAQRELALKRPKMHTKTCVKCGSIFVSKRCGVCAKEYQTKWYLTNAEKAKEYARQYRQQNPEQVKAAQRRWLDAKKALPTKNQQEFSQ